MIEAAARMGRKEHGHQVPKLYAQVTVRLDPATYEAAQQAARQAGLSLNAYLAQAIRERAERDTREAKPGDDPTPAP